MSVIIERHNETPVTIEQGIETQVNEDGTLVVFGEQKTGTQGKNRIAVYATGYWSSATVDQGPSKAEQIIEYLAAKMEEVDTEDGTEEAAYLDDLIGELTEKIISPPKSSAKVVIDPEALRGLAAEEAGRKAAQVRPS